MRVLYFAWLREKTGVDREDIVPPDGVTDVMSMIDWLKTRGSGFEEAFADPNRVRAAVNQEAVPLNHAVGPDDEVAFFPPVTGG